MQQKTGQSWFRVHKSVKLTSCTNQIRPGYICIWNSSFGEHTQVQKKIHRFPNKLWHFHQQTSTFVILLNSHNNIQYYVKAKSWIKGILWDRKWSPPSIGICSHPRCWFVYRNAFLIMKLSNLPSFRAIRVLIALQSTFEK